MAPGSRAPGDVHRASNADSARAQAFVDAAICFFVPFLAAAPTGSDSAIDIFAVGETINICMLGVVTMEIMIVARFWTGWFAAACAISYALVYPFTLTFPLAIQAVGSWDMAHSGVAANVMRTPFFWVSIVTVYAITFTIRYFERSAKWLFRPDDSMAIAELEQIEDCAERRGVPRRSYADPKIPRRSLLQTASETESQVAPVRGQRARRRVAWRSRSRSCGRRRCKRARRSPRAMLIGTRAARRRKREGDSE